MKKDVKAAEEAEVKQEEQVQTPPPQEAKPITEAEAEKRIDEMTDRLAARANKRYTAAMAGVKQVLRTLSGEEEPCAVCDEAKKILEEQGDAVKEEVTGLPASAQIMWAKIFTSAKQHADDVNKTAKTKSDPEEYAKRLAWSSVGKCFVKSADDKWIPRGSSIKFDARVGKWVVDDKHLLCPISVSSKQEAELLFNVLSNVSNPQISYENDKFQITHPDWKEPVLANTAEEAVGVVTDKLKDEGWSDPDATAKAKESVESVQKEKVMSSIKVEADAKQNTKGGTDAQPVTGITPKTEGIKQPKGGEPVVPGHTVTETPKGGPEAAKSHPHEIKTDYESQAKKHDKMVEQLKGKHGLMTTTAAAIDKFGAHVIKRAQEEGQAALRDKYLDGEAFSRAKCVEEQKKGEFPDDADSFCGWLEQGVGQ